MMVVCQHCGTVFDKKTAEWRRARVKRFFCTQKCSGLAHRKGLTMEQKKIAKAAYDAEYRARNASLLREKKRQYHAINYDPEKARQWREKNAAMIKRVRHAILARPEYKAAKAAYDADLRSFEYGDYHDCHKLLVQLERAVRASAPWYERAKARGYYANRRKQDRRRP